MKSRELIGIIVFWPLHIYCLGESMTLMGSADKASLYLGYVMFAYSVIAITVVTFKYAPKLMNGCMEEE